MLELSLSEVDALRVVVKKGGQVRLADFMGHVGHGSIRETVDGLIERGLLHKFEGWSGFSKNVELYGITETGREALAQSDKNQTF